MSFHSINGKYEIKNRTVDKYIHFFKTIFVFELITIFRIMKNSLLKVILIVAFISCLNTNYAQAQVSSSNVVNKSQESQKFLDLSKQIWDFMATKDAESLKKIFHLNSMFVHMGGYWGSEQELNIIGQGFIHYKKADVSRVEAKKINDNNWAVYSTIVLDAVLGGNNTVTTPFFVTQTFTLENGTWWLTAMAFTSRNTGQRPGDQNQPRN